MSAPVDFIDTEKILVKLEKLDERMERIEGVLEAVAAALEIPAPPPKKEETK